MIEKILQPVRIGLLSISDRAFNGTYEDKGLPALRHWLQQAILNPIDFVEKLVPDEQKTIEQSLIELCDQHQCHLICTTGGTGPAKRDVTPEATLAIAHKELPGFGEQMRQIGLRFVPTAILSRQIAVVRNSCLVINLPGQPKAISETLGGFKASTSNASMDGVFACVPYCIDLIGGPYIETRQDVICAYRPRSAQ